MDNLHELKDRVASRVGFGEGLFDAAENTVTNMDHEDLWRLVRGDMFVLELPLHNFTFHDTDNLATAVRRALIDFLTKDASLQMIEENYTDEEDDNHASH